jgi:hypothetical protein
MLSVRPAVSENMRVRTSSTRSFSDTRAGRVAEDAGVAGRYPQFLGHAATTVQEGTL